MKLDSLPAHKQVIALLVLGGGFALGQSTNPQINSVANAASGANTLAPGSLAVIFGNNLRLQEPSTVPNSVFVNGIDAAVLQVNPQQLTVELPVDVPIGKAQVRVSNQVSLSEPFQIMLNAYAPGIFVTNDGLGSLWHADGIVSLSNPAHAGETLSLLCTGLGPTTPVVPTGAGSPSAPRAYANTQAVVSVDDNVVASQPGYLEPGLVGQFRVFFTLPQTISAGTHSVNLTIGGKASNSVQLLVAGSGLPSISAVVSAAGFISAGLVAPGSIVSITGANFGQIDTAAAFPATSVGGTSVSFNGVKAPLFAVIASQNLINAYVPTELSDLGSAEVIVATTMGSSSGFPVHMTPASPSIFRIPDPSGKIANNAAAVLAGTAWIAAPDSLADALHIPKNCTANNIAVVSTCAQPITAGDIVAIFATGLGKATVGGDPAGAILATGSVAPSNGIPLYRTLDVPTVMIGGIAGQVLFSGLTPGSAGLYQLNVKVPQGVQSGDQVPLTVTTSNSLTDTTTIAVR